MRPAKQGDYDALCGVYAIINCLHVLGLGRRSYAFHKEVFEEIAHGLGPTGLLAAMRDGLEADDLVSAAKIALPTIGARHGISLSLDQPFRDQSFASIDEFLFELQGSILSCGAAAIVNVLGPAGYDHWTVPTSIGNGKMTLRDSDGVKSLALWRFSHPAACWHIAWSNTLRLRRA